MANEPRNPLRTKNAKRKPKPKPGTPGKKRGVAKQPGGRPISPSNANPIKFTSELKKIFLDMLATNGQVHACADAVGVSGGCIYQHKKKDPLFAAAFAEAKLRYTELLEAEAHRRAVEGVERLVVQKGEVVYHNGEPITERHYSDSLLTLLLKSNHPEKYREQATIDMDVKGGVLVVPPQSSPEDWIKEEQQRMADLQQRNTSADSDSG